MRSKILSLVLALAMILTLSMSIWGLAINLRDEMVRMPASEISDAEIFEVLAGSYAWYLYNIGEEGRFLDEILRLDVQGVIIDKEILRGVVFEILDEYWSRNDNEIRIDAPISNEVERETEIENQNIEEERAIIDEENEVNTEEDLAVEEGPVLNILEEREFVFELESSAERVIERAIERERPRRGESRQINAATGGNVRVFEVINESLVEAQVEYETSRENQASESRFVLPEPMAGWNTPLPATIIDILGDEGLAWAVANYLNMSPWSMITSMNQLNQIRSINVQSNVICPSKPRIRDLAWAGSLGGLNHFVTYGQAITDLSPIYGAMRWGSWTFFESLNNDIEVEGRREGNYLIAPMVARDFDGLNLSVSSCTQWFPVMGSTGFEIRWNLNNIAEYKEYVTYSWLYSTRLYDMWWQPALVNFSGTVRVRINPVTVAPEAATVFPTVDLFTRHDAGLQAQTAKNMFIDGGGMGWNNPHHQTANLVIGANDGTAYRETFVRFDLSDEEIAGIMRATGERNDRVLFNLYVTDAIGTAQIRTIDLHLVPANRVGAININYPRWEDVGGVPTQVPTFGARWMSALDAFGAGISVRDNFSVEGIAPVATSDRIFRNMAGVRDTQLNRYFTFDLTEALQSYFSNLDNAGERRVGFVLSNRIHGGLVTAATSRAGEETSPKLTIPVYTPTAPIYPAVDLFVRHDRGLDRQSGWSYRDLTANGLNWQNPRGTDLVIGTNNASSAWDGAYRETFMRFDLRPDQIERILSATGIGDDRAVFRLFVTGRAGTAMLRDIDLHLIPGYRVYRIRDNHGAWTTQNWVLTQGPDTPHGWMSAYDAYRAQITARENFRYYQWSTRPTATSEPIFYNMPGVPNTGFGKYVEFDLTDALKAYFSDPNNAGRTSFGFVLSILRGNGLVTAASSRRANRANAPHLRLPETFLEIDSMAGGIYEVFVTSENITNGNREIIVTYNTDYLELVNLWALDSQKILQPWVRVDTTGTVEGTVRIRTNIPISNGNSFSGLLATLRFQARGTGTSRIFMDNRGR